ncbi:hypothetical protein [Candidatus Nitrosoglobus terrae]|nr:hypothetical protein [Candidatus Nitrosoglobus terrae]
MATKSPASRGFLVAGRNEGRKYTISSPADTRRFACGAKTRSTL